MVLSLKQNRPTRSGSPRRQTRPGIAARPAGSRGCGGRRCRMVALHPPSPSSAPCRGTSCSSPSTLFGPTRSVRMATHPPRRHGWIALPPTVSGSTPRAHTTCSRCPRTPTSSRAGCRPITACATMPASGWPPAKPRSPRASQALGFQTGAFISAFPLDSRFGLSRGFDVYDDAFVDAAPRPAFLEQERAGPETVAAALRWLQERRADRETVVGLGPSLRAALPVRAATAICLAILRRSLCR